MKKEVLEKIKKAAENYTGVRNWTDEEKEIVRAMVETGEAMAAFRDVIPELLPRRTYKAVNEVFKAVKNESKRQN